MAGETRRAEGGTADEVCWTEGCAWVGGVGGVGGIRAGVGAGSGEVVWVEELGEGVSFGGGVGV